MTEHESDMWEERTVEDRLRDINFRRRKIAEQLQELRKEDVELQAIENDILIEQHHASKMPRE